MNSTFCETLPRRHLRQVKNKRIGKKIEIRGSSFNVLQYNDKFYAINVALGGNICQGLGVLENDAEEKIEIRGSFCNVQYYDKFYAINVTLGGNMSGPKGVRK